MQISAPALAGTEGLRKVASLIIFSSGFKLIQSLVLLQKQEESDALGGTRASILDGMCGWKIDRFSWC